MTGEVLVWCEGKTCIEVEDAPVIEIEEIREEEDSCFPRFLSAASSARRRKICDDLPDREEQHQIHDVPRALWCWVRDAAIFACKRSGYNSTISLGCH